MWRFAATGLVLVGLILTAGCRRGSNNNNNPPAPVAQMPPLPDDVDPEPRIAFRYDQAMRFGLMVIKDATGATVNKKLTYADDGQTNDTMVRIDLQDVEFGSPAGNFSVRDQRVGRMSKSVWTTRGVEITQILEIVPSKQPVDIAPGQRKRIMDTCVVRYEIVNKDSNDHSVGMRVMVDTLIGNNDGVPFAVPTMLGMVNTFKDFNNAKDVPDFVQALEVPNLQNPGTVGLMTLKVGGDVDPPSRVSLTAWMPPANQKGMRIINWEIPVRPMFQDSAVALYWNADRALKPNEKRTLGYSYGLGRLNAAGGTGQLALTLNGSFFPTGRFTVTAYVQRPTPGQTMTLELPKELKLAEGNATLSVPPPGVGGPAGQPTSILTWKVDSTERGKFMLNVRSSSGVSQKQEVTIRGE